MITAPELPQQSFGVKARHIDGILECWVYAPSRREFIVRHDAIVDGKHLTTCAEPIDGICVDVDAALARRRAPALAWFRSQEAT